MEKMVLDKGAELFKVDGSSGDPDLERAWLLVADSVFEVFKDRQRKYGPRNIAKTGEMGVIVRLNDKIERLNNLLLEGRGKDVEDETAIDTWIDAADYPIIALLCVYGFWPNAPSITKPVGELRGEGTV